MTRRTVDGLIAWLVYAAGLGLTIISLTALVYAGEQVAFVASIGLLAGLGACAYARHLFTVMARIDRAQAHIQALLDAAVAQRPLDPRDVNLWVRQILDANEDQIIDEAER